MTDLIPGFILLPIYRDPEVKDAPPMRAMLVRTSAIVSILPYHRSHWNADGVTYTLIGTDISMGPDAGCVTSLPIADVVALMNGTAA
jgi:hypothetical protein